MVHGAPILTDVHGVALFTAPHSAIVKGKTKGWRENQAQKYGECQIRSAQGVPSRLRTFGVRRCKIKMRNKKSKKDQSPMTII